MKTPAYSALSTPRPTPAQTVEALKLKLEPASDWQIEKALAYLIANLPIENIDDDVQLIAKREGLIDSCRGYPAAALEETVAAFVNGRVVGASRSFCPKSAELGAEIARRVSHDRDRLAAAKRVAAQAEAIEAERTAPLSDEARELARRRIVELKAISQEERENIRFKPPAHPELDQYRGEIGKDGRRLPIRESLPSRIGYAGAPSKPVTAEDAAHLPDAPPRGTVEAAGAMRPVKGYFPAFRS